MAFRPSETLDGTSLSVIMVLTMANPNLSRSDILSIAICTYNNAALLNEALRALEQQRFSDKQLLWTALVIDNASTDETHSVVQTYIQRGLIPKLRYIHESQQGLAFARRRAVRETEGNLIAFVDDDCLLDPHWVEQAILFCQKHPKAGAVGGKVELIWEVPPNSLNVRFSQSLAEQDYGNSELCLQHSRLVGAGLLLRRRALHASGWPENMALVDRCGNALSAGGDSEIVCRVRNAGFDLWYNPSMQLAHHIPRRRMSISYLCRLHRGFGHNVTILSAIEQKRRITIIWCLRMFAIHLRDLCLLLLSIAIRDFMVGQKVAPHRKIALQESIGKVEGVRYALFSRPLT